MRIRASAPRGFTLVELLVVISIIGMLMAMLLPAVQSARESGRANTCRNNMKNLGLAILQYETQLGEFPGYVQDIDLSAATNDNDKRSWVFLILPYMDHRSLFEQYKTATPPTLNQDIVNGLEVTICPATRRTAACRPRTTMWSIPARSTAIPLRAPLAQYIVARGTSPATACFTGATYIQPISPS